VGKSNPVDKSFDISKRLVWEAYKSVKANQGAAGVDGQSVEEFEADLIVMATDGRNGFLDGLRGSHSERILRYGAAPLLTIPIGSRISRHLI